MIINLSLDYEWRGYACLHEDGENMTIFLLNISPLLYRLDSLPFDNIEDIIEEFVIHELIHKFTRIREDKIIDGWHIVLCHLYNPTLGCKCPIDCFWRSQLGTA